jgi:membrane protein implicated in regulation of membrane protease activity
VALTIALILAILFLPWPWSLLAILGGLAIETGELAWGLRLARRWKPKTGAEAMIGKEAEVKVHGELWRALCEDGAEVGERVCIEGIKGLTLLVTRASASD